MTREEALETIASTEGSICVQLQRRPDGTISTGDCWARLRRARRRGLLAFAAAVPLVIAAQLWSMAVGLGGLASFFRRPAPAIQAPAPSAPAIQPEIPMPPLGGPPPLVDVERIRAEHRSRRAHARGR